MEKDVLMLINILLLNIWTGFSLTQMFMMDLL